MEGFSQQTSTMSIFVLPCLLIEINNSLSPLLCFYSSYFEALIDAIKICFPQLNTTITHMGSDFSKAIVDAARLTSEPVRWSGPVGVAFGVAAFAGVVWSLGSLNATFRNHFGKVNVVQKKA